MDILTFIASVIGSLAWPVTIATVVWFLIRNIKAIARFVHSIKYKDVQFIFRDELEKIKDIGDQIQIATKIDLEKKDVTAIESEALRLVKFDSGVAVLKSWKKLEAKIIQLIQHNGLIRFTDMDNFIKRLHQLGKFSQQELDLYHGLKRMRNEVVHAGSHERPLTAAEVLEYDDFVEVLITRLEHIRKQPDYVDVK